MKNILSIVIHLISRWLVVSDHKDCKITKENGGVGFGVHYKNSTAVTIKRLIDPRLKCKVPGPKVVIFFLSYDNFGRYVEENSP